MRFVAGADEAGRGCLAGPLVAAAVLLDLNRIGPAQARALGMLNDSKQQSPEGRAALYPVILSIAARVSIVTRCAPGIDARGLHKTNLAALRDALNGWPARAASASATASPSPAWPTSSAR